MSTSDLSPVPPAPPPPRPGRLRRALSGRAALALAAALAVAQAPPAAAATPMHLGAVGHVAELSQQIGHPLAVHAYGHFERRVPDGRMISVRAAASWREVAAAGPGSALYDHMVRWARTIRDRPGPVLLAYHHEPEADGSLRYGTAAEFVAAYRRVVSVFRAEGVQNVRFTWQMTDWAFRASPSDRRHAAHWYPGDEFVDHVGADVYNWSGCGPGRGAWKGLDVLAGPALEFARAHGKQASLPEFGADPDPRRAQWLADAHAYLVANRDVVAAAFYFNRGPTNPANSDCAWTLTEAAEHRAYAAMAADRAHFTT